MKCEFYKDLQMNESTTKSVLRRCQAQYRNPLNSYSLITTRPKTV